ncbi:MAG: MFS transporter [Sphingopyxis sp.]|nr:MFS transporter [Sphingopyxis sp.]
MRESASRLPFGTILLFALPALLVGFMHGPEQQIQGIYAKYAGLALSALAAATLLTRAFDAITYPLIGYLSDLTYARTGTRKPWVAGGALFSAFGVWFLYRPPADAGIVYYGVWTAVTYLGWKVAEIPYQAWSYALTRDYADRARLQAWRAMAQLFGGMIFFATPALAKGLGMTKSGDLGFAALDVTAILCAVLVPLAAILVIWRVREGEARPPAPAERPHYGLFQTLRSVLRNRPMMWLIGAALPVAILTGIATGVTFLFLDVYLQLGEAYPTVLLASAPMALIGVPLWSFLGAKFERHRVVAVSLVLGAISYLALSFVPPGPGAFTLVLIFYPLTILALLGIVVLFPMIGDIADYGRLQTGEDLSGLYTAVFNFVQVSLRTVSSAAGIAVVGWMGFDATAATQSPGGALAIRLTAVILPAIGLAFAGALFWAFPLTRAKIAEVHAQLAERETTRESERADLSR